MKRVEISEEQFISDSLAIVQECEGNGVAVRILGSLCGYVHNIEHDGAAKDLYLSLGRLGDGGPIFTDLDLMAFSSQRGKVMDVFEKKLKLTPDRYFNMSHGHQRLIYHKPGAFGIDLFFDRLEYSHTVDFGSKPDKGRLNLDYPTITLSDFMLEKLQIHQINRKDLVDMALVLKYHDISEHEEKQKVNGTYIAMVLSDDWGFWYDATQNLAKTKDTIDSLAHSGGLGDPDIIKTRLDRLSSIIQLYPKGKKWQSRSAAGTSKPWYTEVGDFAL